MLFELRSELPVEKGRWQVVRTSVTRRRVLVLLVGVVCCTFCAAAPKKQDNRDDWQQAARVVEDLGLKDGSRIADIGCGRGYFTYRLGKAVGAKGKVYATEISEKAIKSVVDRVKRDNIKNIETVISEATKTKLASDSLDAAVICLVLHHVPKDKRAALTKDVCRSIKPGGYLYIIDWRVKAAIKHDKDRRVPKADLIKFATDAGMVLDAEFHYLSNQVFLRLRKPIKAK